LFGEDGSSPEIAFIVGNKFTISEEISETVREGYKERSIAATPDTCGVAIEVPLKIAKLVSDNQFADVISSPGANISTHLPKLEYVDFAVALEIAPTVIAAGALAGEIEHASIFSFPAATTTRIPALIALFT
jgi:hypothetical protein